MPPSITSHHRTFSKGFEKFQHSFILRKQWHRKWRHYHKWTHRKKTSKGIIKKTLEPHQCPAKYLNAECYWGSIIFIFTTNSLVFIAFARKYQLSDQNELIINILRHKSASLLRDMFSIPISEYQLLVYVFIWSLSAIILSIEDCRSVSFQLRLFQFEAMFHN